MALKGDFARFRISCTTTTLLCSFLAQNSMELVNTTKWGAYGMKSIAVPVLIIGCFGIGNVDGLSTALALDTSSCFLFSPHDEMHLSLAVIRIKLDTVFKTSTNFHFSRHGV
ncbi:hypothetical protein RHMOL_Rhmol06G0020300 [Rhododendron molle]|uniref:Uncharacterized protein n=1 Tax=Rhododendron molle TaxID=49168 RepID=A0ACC0N7U2_RHOML|nr:hypothetical protein RHMOL_Rhmol06G0020300 [Rhododendron molle]